MAFLFPVITEILSFLIWKSLWFIRDSDMSLEVALNEADEQKDTD